MSKPPKIDRKELKGPDEFVKRGQWALDLVAENRGILLAFVLGIIVIIAGVETYQWWFSGKIEKGWVAYDDAIKLPEKERWDRLKDFSKEFGSMRPTYFAQIALADHFYNEAADAFSKDPKAAETAAASSAEWYGKALEFKKLLPAEKQLVLINRGNSYELLGKLDLALQDYQAASQIQGEANGYAMLKEGRLWQKKKEAAKASERYEKIIADFANTEYAKQAKSYLRLMKSPIFKDTKPNAS